MDRFRVTRTAMLVLAVGLVVVAMTGCRGSRSDRIAKRMESRFAEVDADGDGYLSPDEFRTTRVGQRAEDPDAAFTRIDANGDGRLDRAEMRAAIEATRRKQD